MYSENKNRKTLLFIIFLSFTFIFISSETIPLGNDKCHMTVISERLIFIYESNNKIWDYTNNIESTHDADIIRDKEIIKMNGNNFAIFGFNINNQFLYQIYKIEGNTISSTPTIFNLGFSTMNIVQYNLRYLTKYNSFILSINNNVEDDSENFRFYQVEGSSLLDFNQPTFKEHTSIYRRDNVQCDSPDGNNIFCVFNWKSSDYILYYGYGTRRNLHEGKICSNCRAGNVVSVFDGTTQKYMVCYINTNKHLICKYYYVQDDNLFTESEHEMWRGTDATIIDKPLILKNYDYSIFIEIEASYAGGGGTSGILIMTSFDFNIKITSNIERGSIYVHDFINDKNNYYALYQESTSYYVKIQKFAQCIDNEYIYFSQNDRIYTDFLTNHVDESIIFSLDRNTRLYNRDEIVNNYIIEFHALKSSDNFNFRKVELSSAINNYYCYAKIISATEYGYFSLVCRLTLKVCHETCQTCNVDLVSSSVDHNCQKCNDNYYPLISQKDNPIGFNCYSQNERIPFYYFNSATELYEYCDETCKICTSKSSCLICKDGYYFKVDKNDETRILYNEQCFNLANAPESYYLDYTANIYNFERELIPTIFKPCFPNCHSCSGRGTQSAMSCTECEGSLTNYNFNRQQCFIDTSVCTNNHWYWKYENSNITCVANCPYPLSLITTGPNKGQCVKDCQNYINPYSNETDENTLYLSLNCTRQVYCIPYSSCSRINFEISSDGQTCTGECSYFDIFLYNDPYEYFEGLPPITDKEISNVEEKKELIDKRIKITKLFVDDKSKIKFDKTENYYRTLIANYYKVLENELLQYEKANLLYLTTSTKYDNYTVTIYPLDIENFVYEQVFEIQNYGFVNFTKFFPTFLEYEIVEKKTLLIGIIQYNERNTSINDLNYFVFSFNELNDGNINRMGKLINLTENITLLEKSDIIEVSYPLYNYYKYNSSINKRNTETLVDNIKHIYELDPNIQLNNLSDPFYSDICFKFKTDVGTDMTLNDRREEYYINVSLCESNCISHKIITQDTNPRSICNCTVKNDTEFNNPNSQKDELIPYFVPNSKSFSCITESFNSSVTKNPFLWIFILILLFQTGITILGIRNSKKVLTKLFNAPINNVNNDKIRISEESQDSDEIQNNKINLNFTNNEKNDENNLTVPIKVTNPPKKSEEKKKGAPKPEINSKEKDLISGNSSIEFNAKNLNEFTDVSYDEIQIRNIINNKPVNNDKETKGMLMENNYLIDPLAMERELIIKKVYRSFSPLKKDDYQKHYLCGEEILYPEQNNFKPIGHRNKKIVKKLGGQKILAKDLFMYNSENEYKPRYPEVKLKKNNSNDILFSDLIDDEDATNQKIKYGNKNSSNLNTRNKLQLYKSLGNSKNKEEGKNINNKLKTELNVEDASSQIKKKLATTNIKKYRLKKKLQNKNNKLSDESEIKSNEKLKNNNRNIYSKNDIVNDKDEENVDEQEMNEQNEEEYEEDRIRKRRKRNLSLLNLRYFNSNFSEKDDEKILIQENFLLFYMNYFFKRELFYLCIMNKGKILPYFIRYSCLVFYVTFQFVMNCFFFFESAVHNRYLNALNGKSNHIGYYFKKEFVYTIYVCLIVIVFKILVVKLLLYKLFKIGNKHKRLMDTSSEKGLYKDEVKKLKKIRQRYMKCYNLSIKIYFASILALTILFGYTCICYGGIFVNSIGVFFLGFLFSLIFSYIFCAFICFLIVSIFKLGKTLENKCVISFYIVLSTLY